jgi:hypothetical protein
MKIRLSIDAGLDWWTGWVVNRDHEKGIAKLIMKLIFIELSFEWKTWKYAPKPPPPPPAKK